MDDPLLQGVTVKTPEEILKHADILKLEDGDVVVVRGARMSSEFANGLRRATGKNIAIITIPNDASIGVLRSKALAALGEDES